MATQIGLMPLLSEELSRECNIAGDMYETILVMMVASVA